MLLTPNDDSFLPGNSEVAPNEEEKNAASGKNDDNRTSSVLTVPQDMTT